MDHQEVGQQTAREPKISILRDLPLDISGLERDLRDAVKGEVRFDDGSRALYAYDASNYRQIPIGVVVPKDAEDVVNAIGVCRKYGAPVLSRGGGTSLAGECCNVAIVLDFSKTMHRLLSLDAEQRTARFEPGMILDVMRTEANKYNLTFGPDPATHNHCTLGGMIGNNSCGMHAQMSGKTSDNIRELEILLYDGTRMRVKDHYEEAEIAQIIQEGGRKGEIFAKLRDLRDRYAEQIRTVFPDIPRRVSGYGLCYLLPEHGFNVAGALTGTEGTCVVVLEGTGKLVYWPPYRTLLVLGFKDVYTAGDYVKDILPFEPLALEGMDDLLVDFMEKKGMHPGSEELLPEGKGWLIVQFGGDSQEEADARARALIEESRQWSEAPSYRLYDDPEVEATLWNVRESGLGATAFVPGEKDAWPGWEDSACPPDSVGDYLRELRALFAKHGYKPSLYGHFGQGCIHCRVQFELKTAEGLKNYHDFVVEAAHLVTRYGGSLSGEHGDGQSRGELLPIMFGPELVQAFREFKAIWDPDWKMNPGKVIDANPILSNLKLGTSYNPPAPLTHFHYPDDGGSFAHATLRCVGIGKCRRTEGGTMCPSFMVTREEKDTTRGRAHALFEMMQGDVIANGWRDQAVMETLDLCLACKGCKGDCPVNVDMATYKSEFLAHYYEGRMRPVYAYAMGLIQQWSRIAERMPWLVNFVTQTPGLSHVTKWIGGLTTERQIPPYAPETFQAWFKKRGPKITSGPKVVLWPDTFNNHFFPEVAKAAVEVLEYAGCQVIVPDGFVCCGRPLYDYGMLDEAKRHVLDNLETLRPFIRDGVPVVGLEPSCVSVFRDEMTNLFPHDEDAKRLKGLTLMLSEFLDQKLEDFDPPKLLRKATVHVHCHHKSVLGDESEKKILSKLGLDFQVLDDGCCGLAGSFGFERDKYDVSMAIGERALFPAVRKADEQEIIISDGFSCREQISHGTDRKALHLAQVLRMAIQQGPAGPLLGRPEDRYDETPKLVEKQQAVVKAVVLLGTLGILAAWALKSSKDDQRWKRG